MTDGWRSRIVGHGEEAADHDGTRRCCPACSRTYMNEYMRRRRSQRPEVREAERLKALERRAADPEHSREIARRWREAHPDAVKAQNARRDPESQRASNQAYYAAHAEEMRQRAQLRRATHPEDKRRSSALRKARRRATVCALNSREIEAIRSQPCHLCGATEKLTLAHDMPVSRGGATTQENCFSLCVSCNSRMGTKTLREYLDARC